MHNANWESQDHCPNGTASSPTPGPARLPPETASHPARDGLVSRPGRRRGPCTMRRKGTVARVATFSLAGIATSKE